MQYIITEKQSNQINTDETNERAHDSQIVRAKENLKLSHSGPGQRQTSDTNQRIIKALRLIPSFSCTSVGQASDQMTTDLNI